MRTYYSNLFLAWCCKLIVDLMEKISARPALPSQIHCPVYRPHYQCPTCSNLEKTLPHLQALLSVPGLLHSREDTSLSTALSLLVTGLHQPREDIAPFTSLTGPLVGQTWHRQDIFFTEFTLFSDKNSQSKPTLYYLSKYS